MTPIVRYALSGTGCADGTTIINLGSLGSSANGTMNGTASYISAPVGQGFNPQNQWIEGTHIDSLTSWTMSTWVNLALNNFGGNVQHQIASGLHPSTDNGPAFDTYYADGTWLPTQVPGIARRLATRTAIGSTPARLHTRCSANSWYYGTETVTTGQFQVYVNGALIQTVALNASQTPTFSPEANQTLSVGGNDGYAQMQRDR